jgi:hypothetical protein
MTMTEEKKISRPRIDTEAFLKAWVNAVNNDGSQMDVAEELRCSPAGVANKYKKLVAEGAELPELPTGSRKTKVDVDAINKYLKANLKGKK